MAASSVTSPLCTWLVAACMSVTSSRDKDRHSLRNPSIFSSSRTPCRSPRKRNVPAQCTTQFPAPAGLISSLCGSSIQGLMTSCLAFEPCNEYTTSKSPSSLGFFADTAFCSLFRSRNAPLNRRRRRFNRAAYSGGAMAVAVQPAEEVTTKYRLHLKQRRVVVTGLGVVTPLGNDPDVFYNNLLEGVSGISEIETFNCAEFPTKIAGEIKSFSTEGLVAPKFSKRMDKFMLYMITAGKKALADGGITQDVMKELDKSKCGVLIGSAVGGMKVLFDGVEALKISFKKMNPFSVPMATTNMGSAMLAIDLEWTGPNYSISAACATGNYCILNAANHIIRGEADVMLCGGSDAALIPMGLGGFVAFNALSQRNSDPTKASRPWDIDRDGFVLGDGAGVLLLEELEHAKNRGANIYAEFLGGSITCDAHDIVESHPDGVGIIQCMEKALAQSGVSREDVNYINAHAASTPTGDLREYQALIHCFGKNPELRINSSKSMIGHPLGAAGAVEAVATVQAIRTGWVHPNINLENPDDGVDTRVLVGPRKERLDIKAALSNSIGFGGVNSSIILAPFK